MALTETTSSSTNTKGPHRRVGCARVSGAAAGALVAMVLAAPASNAQQLAIYPELIELRSGRDTQRVIATVTFATGVTRDVTSETEFAFPSADEPLAEIAGGTLSPVRDGKGTLVARWNRLVDSARVLVAGVATDPPASLRRDVMPVLMKVGCNAGRCHGAAKGQDGFMLSLFGYDPSGDRRRLLEDITGRRINLARPSASLLLTKATGEAPHTGGQRMEVGDASHQTLRRWIAEGAKDDPAAAPTPVSLTISPPQLVFQGSGKTQQLVVQAEYSDGSLRDVSELAVYFSNNDNTASVNEQGAAASSARGEAYLMARFDALTAGVPVIVLPEGAPPAAMPVAFNEIDKAVYDKLSKLRIEPSGVCTDEEFLRRVSIDLTGMTPTPELWEAFRSNPSPKKREELVGKLLQTDAFTDVWTMRLGELLGIRTSNQVSYKALLAFHGWVREQVAENRPLDDLLTAVLTSRGGTFASPATNYYQIEANTLQIAENVAQSYLGMRIQCARCHNHPFDRWTMDDYYGFAAFFSQVGFKQSRDPREFVVYNRGQGEALHFVGGQPVAPKPLTDRLAYEVDAAATDPAGASAAAERDRREELADWLHADGKHLLARNVANIAWAHHFGRGIVEPVDDVRISNPPSNGPLLDLLAERLINTGYDLRDLVRLIVTSRTYQLSSNPNETNAADTSNFARASVRRMRAEALLDSIGQITGVTSKFPRMPAGARAAEIADGAVSNYFLSTFGRASRETVCACEVEVEPNLSQALHLINGDSTNDKIAQGNVVGQLLDDGMSASEVIARLYVACLGRAPSDAELSQLLASQAGQPDRAFLEDVFWALLNSKEFVFNR